MPIFEQTPILLLADIISQPPVEPVDANTNQPIRFWRGNGISVAVGIFDSDGVAVDLSNLLYLQMVLKKTPLSPAVLATVVVEAADIIPTVSRAEFLAGENQQATFVFTAAQTDQGLEGGTEAPFWLALQGKTSGGVPITYAAGYITIYNPGSSIPAPVPGLVSWHEQDSDSSDTVLVEPTSQIHTEEITASGSPETRDVVIQAINLYPGAQVRLRFVLPATDGLIFAIYDQSVEGTLLYTLTCDDTGATPTALIELVFDGTDFRVLQTVLPAVV